MKITPTTDKFDAAIAETLRAHLGRKQITRKAIADETGIPLVTLERYIRGERSIPVSSLVLVARALDIETVGLIEEAERHLSA